TPTKLARTGWMRMSFYGVLFRPPAVICGGLFYLEMRKRPFSSGRLKMNFRSGVFCHLGAKSGGACSALTYDRRARHRRLDKGSLRPRSCPLESGHRMHRVSAIQKYSTLWFSLESAAPL